MSHLFAHAGLSNKWNTFPYIVKYEGKFRTMRNAVGTQVNRQRFVVFSSSPTLLWKTTVQYSWRIVLNHIAVTL